MQVTRREFIIGSGAAFSLGLFSLPAFAKSAHNVAKSPFSSLDPAAAFSVLNRIGYGPTPALWQECVTLGLEKYLEAQLNPVREQDMVANDKIAAMTLHIEYKAKEPKPTDKPDEPMYPALKEERLLTSLDKPIEELWKLTEGKKFNYNEQIRPAQEVRAATWLRAVYGKWQLQEVMVEFWHNHFNVNAFGDTKISAVMPVYDALIRQHCFGNFRIFLEAVAGSAAMAFYLNNAKSKASPANENYARELFELHTLGAENYYNSLYNRWREVPGALKSRPIGYIDQDVYEAARAFTGWTIEDGSNTGRGTILPLTGKFHYFEGWHDNYQKRVLGNEFDPNTPPLADGRKVLDLLSAHPGTAHYLCTKLCRRLISDNPPEAIVKKAAAAWMKYQDDPEQIKHVLRTIILSHEFMIPSEPKVKRPFEFVASFLRGTGVDFIPTEQLFNSMTETGYRHFAWPTPTGHPDTAEYWLNTNSTLGSWNIVAGMALGEIKAVQLDLAAQTPSHLQTAAQWIEYWIRRLTGKVPDSIILNALMQYMPAPDNYNYPVNLNDNKDMAAMQQVIMTIAMSPDFQVK